VQSGNSERRCRIETEGEGADWRRGEEVQTVVRGRRWRLETEGRNIQTRDIGRSCRQEAGGRSYIETVDW
jgi:hypothetical protein